jgi:hypothetical protein
MKMPQINIKFVFIDDDIAWESFTMRRNAVGKQVLNQLKIPWILIMGNNNCV